MIQRGSNAIGALFWQLPLPMRPVSLPGQRGIKHTEDLPEPDFVVNGMAIDLNRKMSTVEMSWSGLLLGEGRQSRAGARAGAKAGVAPHRAEPLGLHVPAMRARVTTQYELRPRKAGGVRLYARDVAVKLMLPEQPSMLAGPAHQPTHTLLSLVNMAMRRNFAHKLVKFDGKPMDKLAHCMRRKMNRRLAMFDVSFLQLPLLMKMHKLSE